MAFSIVAALACTRHGPAVLEGPRISVRFAHETASVPGLGEALTGCLEGKITLGEHSRLDLVIIDIAPPGEVFAYSDESHQEIRRYPSHARLKLLVKVRGVGTALHTVHTVAAEGDSIDAAAADACARIVALISR
ncbi:MAG: hypothetical protein EPN93_01355 [Spirochaetes bacterium]|nr:MAG: hypothetical protein EPN93_01355 [Spirochaetota bacterium]